MSMEWSDRRRIPKALAALGPLSLLVAFLAFGIFPFYWMVRTAIVPSTDVTSFQPRLLPIRVTLDNLTEVLTSPTIPFLVQFRNSVVVSAGATVLTLVLGMWGAYALARLQFRGKRPFGLALLLVQFVPAVVLVIPLFVVLAKLGLVNSHLGLIIAYSTGTLPVTVWLLRGYFLSIPPELEDAARIDGCGYFGVIFRIVLPIASPGIAAAATLTFISAWNEFLLAQVLINDNSKQVLSVGLSLYVDQFRTDYTGLFAMATLTTLPVVAVFMVFQRYLVGGLAAGAVK